MLEQLDYCGHSSLFLVPGVELHVKLVKGSTAVAFGFDSNKLSKRSRCHTIGLQPCGRSVYLYSSMSVH